MHFSTKRMQYLLAFLLVFGGVTLHADCAFHRYVNCIAYESTNCGTVAIIECSDNTIWKLVIPSGKEGDLDKFQNAFTVGTEVYLLPNYMQPSYYLGTKESVVFKVDLAAESLPSLPILLGIKKVVTQTGWFTPEKSVDAIALDDGSLWEIGDLSPNGEKMRKSWKEGDHMLLITSDLVDHSDSCRQLYLIDVDAPHKVPCCYDSRMGAGTFSSGVKMLKGPD